MSLALSLNNAISGLNANSKRIEVTSTNLANALTKGYGRKSVEAGALVLDGNGSGVAVLGINRAASPELTATRRQADGDAAVSTVTAEGFARLGQILGEATNDDSLFRRVQDLETSLRTLAETPESEPRQSAAVDAARDLASELNTASLEIAAVRQNADAAIADQVTTVNNNLQQISELNAKIQRLNVGGRDVSNLVDQRELLIDEVSSIIPARTHIREGNVVHLSTSQGLFLVADTAANIEFTRTPVITTPMVYDPAGGALSGITLHGVDITPTSGRVQAIDGGSLAGNFAVRDQTAPEVLSQIDQFAADLIQRFEDPTVDTTLAVGDPGLFTDAGIAFDSTVVEGLAGRIALNTLVDPSQGGDVARLRDGLQSAGPGPASSDVIARSYLDALTAPRSAAAIPGVEGSLTAAQMVSGITEALGILRTNAELEAATKNATRETLASAEAEEIGVDNDAELAALIQIEQAFAANVQVIQATSRMFQEVVEIA